MDSFLYRFTAEEQTHFHDLLLGIEINRRMTYWDPSAIRTLANDQFEPDSPFYREVADEIESGFTGGEELP